MTVAPVLTPPRRAEILAEIEEKHGRMAPDVVVLEATAEDHPFHPEFEWDDKVAGHQHRIEQARRLIRSIRVEVQVETIQLKPSYYVRDPEAEAGEQGYAQLLQIASEDELAERALAGELDRAEGILRRAFQVAAALKKTQCAERITSALEALGRG